ncbi:MAG TPA: glycoside hydrolase family 15 protein [Vicinamibacterales bacterium]|nr:glycoside hydrolase family 15 protein [Vicinamibacterales bacterium]
MRINRYARIEDYALIGDGRTAALVARDGSIDWLCLPNFDSPSIFAAALDPTRGGTFELQPVSTFESTRRYVADTNVLETTFTTGAGCVRVVDALTLPNHGLEPMRELARSIEGVSGRVPMRWRFAPRFDYGQTRPRWHRRGRMMVAANHVEAVALSSWNAGTAVAGDGDSYGTFEMHAGDRALLAMSTAYAEPLIDSPRGDVEGRLAHTIAFWRRWTQDRHYDGPWGDAVRRSALVLKILIFSASGASVAAPTTSLPEAIGGPRNWDYRFCWIRDSNFLIDALLQLGCFDEAHSLFWWFMQATALTEPELHVLYRLDGGPGVPERELPLAGYRGSRPVRVGNSAVDQLQLDIYGGLFETAWLYSEGHHSLDRDTGAVLARVADHVCDIWRQPDSGIWEVRNGPFQFTHSKAMCWAALDRAVRLAERGELPSRHVQRWRREASAIQDFVETQCWSASLDSYTRVAGSHDVDASLLMLPTIRFPNAPRLASTVDAVNRHLRKDDFVYRYHADDGVPGSEGCFLNCSFWLVSALARTGRVADATALMERLVARANDVGLYSEEIDPANGGFLGNFPQALVHLALIEAAVAIGSRS